jgi:hypothetical protein
MWGLIDQSPYNNHSTVTLSITEGGINGNLSSVLIIQLLLINSIPQITKNHYQRIESVFMKKS